MHGFTSTVCMSNACSMHVTHVDHLTSGRSVVSFIESDMHASIQGLMLVYHSRLRIQ